MIIVDVETTGTDQRVHSLISIGAVDFDFPEREFYEECRIFPGAKIEKEATEINGVGEVEANDPHRQTEKELLLNFFKWMDESTDHTIGGQNPHFDTGFLEETARRNHLNFSIPRRVIDLHSVAIAHMAARGLKYPLQHNRSDLNSDKIMAYVGIPKEERPHVAIGGARIEAEAFSRLLRNQIFYKSYEDYPIPWMK